MTSYHFSVVKVLHLVAVSPESFFRIYRAGSILPPTLFPVKGYLETKLPMSSLVCRYPNFTFDIGPSDL
jgi:hypothetical protein